MLPCKPGKALSLWSEAVLEGLALLYLTCHESEVMTRTRGEIMDEGFLDSVKSDLFRVLRTSEYSDAMTIKEILLGSELLLVRVSTES